MIVDKPYYKRNSEGEIVKRQIVTVKCDICGREWDSAYEHRKRKRHEDDRCSKCRGKVKRCPASERKQPQEVVCAICNKTFLKHISQGIEPPNYCSRECLSKSSLKKYEHLTETFAEHPNEVAYLFGLILGDGWQGNIQTYTSKFVIAFDEKHEDVLELAKSIMSKLEITYYIQSKVQNHCQVINMILPKDLLKKYNMLWSGDKYTAQPKPIDAVVNNINFAAGLFNSDGYCEKVKGRWERIGFCNTCLSIVNSMRQSLDYNNIDHGHYSYQPKPDKRNGHLPRKNHQIIIGKKETIDKLRNISPYLKS